MQNDILNTKSEELKQMPYSVPDGYFENLEARLQIHERPARSGLFRLISPYASMAAAFVILVTAGTFLLQRTTEQKEMTYEDFIVHSDYMLSEGYDEEFNVIETQMEENDIIEYLIYTGVTAEVIELSK